jgi:outer membrane protein, multidrug efflux system
LRRDPALLGEELLQHLHDLIGAVPKLSLTGMVGKASPELSAITAGGSTIWSIAAGLAGPLFQGGRIFYNYRATQAVWDQARLQYEQAVIRAFQEVASNLDALDRLSQADAELARAVEALTQSVQHAIDRYLYGFASYFEVLEAEERLYSAQNAQVSIRLNRLLAYVKLYKALGGGWNVTDPAAPPPSPPRAACDSRSC